MLVKFSQWWGSHAGEVLCWRNSHTAGEVLILVKFSLCWWGSHASEVLTVVRFSCGWGSLLVRFSHSWWDSQSAGEVLSLLARLSCWWGSHTAGKVLTSLVTFSHCQWGSHTDGEVLTLLVASALYNFIRCLNKKGHYYCQGHWFLTLFSLLFSFMHQSRQQSTLWWSQ